MYYYSTDNKKRKTAGIVASLAYVALWVVLMFTVRFDFRVPPAPAEGIMINFGDVAEAGGDDDLAMSDVSSPVVVESVPAGSPRDVVTQNVEDAPAIAPRRQDAPQTASTQQERPREADPRALFPGRTPGSTSTSEGTGTGAGNQGNPAGSPTGSHTGTGTGTSGISFALQGRSPVGEVRPDYGGNERGRYIVKIRVTVNPAGSVVSAEYQAQGSTTNSREFVDEALKAARRQAFTSSDGDNLQTGVITYIFNVG